MDHNLFQAYPAVTEKLIRLEKLTGIKKENAALGLITFIILYITAANFASTVSDVIGLIYPLYCSVRAQESERKEDREFWYRYWIVYSSLLLVEFIAVRLLTLIPAYYFVRTIFVVWCMAPCALNGSHYVYFSVIQPLFMKNHETLESAFSMAATEMTNLGRDVLESNEDCDSKDD